jgi:hypothetical protein
MTIIHFLIISTALLSLLSAWMIFLHFKTITMIKRVGFVQPEIKNILDIQDKHIQDLAGNLLLLKLSVNKLSSKNSHASAPASNLINLASKFND